VQGRETGHCPSEGPGASPAETVAERIYRARKKSRRRSDGSSEDGAGMGVGRKPRALTTREILLACLQKIGSQSRDRSQ